jgi:hypothetical protein
MGQGFDGAVGIVVVVPVRVGMVLVHRVVGELVLGQSMVALGAGSMPVLMVMHVLMPMFMADQGALAFGRDGGGTGSTSADNTHGGLLFKS